jgi:putative tricarboxylic transport membrane protein
MQRPVKPGDDNEAVMFERALNAFWILLGAAAAAYAWTLGVVGPAGPESGLFPLIAAVIIMGAGIVLLFGRSAGSSTAGFPRGAALGRILGVVAGLAVMALGMPYLGFAATGAITMIILWRTVEQSSWIESIGLTLGSVVAVVWLFGHVLGMILPRGPWGF